MGTLADKLEYLEETKEAIKNAIIAKGQTVSSSDTFRSYAQKVRKISGGGGALISKTITENGTYDAIDDDADGYSDVTVDVPINTKNILSGSSAPTSSIGSNGDIYLLYKDVNTTGILSYLQTNNSDINVSLSNWTYRNSDKIILKYKNAGNHTGLFGRFLEISSPTQLYIAYNLWNGRQCMNIRHGGGYSGDGAYEFDGPYNTDKYFAVIVDGSDFLIMSGSERDNYTQLEAKASLGTADDTDQSSPILNAATDNKLNIEFHELEVYRDGILIHDYFPIQGGIKDAVENVGYPIMSQAITYGTSYTIEEKPVYKVYCKVDGVWQALEGTDFADIKTEGGSGKNILKGTDVPTTLDGADGDVYFLYLDTHDLNYSSFLRTNNKTLDLTLSNWVYKYSDKFVLKYKNVGSHGGSWGVFLQAQRFQQLLIQYNLYYGRTCMNLYHNEAYSGDGAYTFDSPYNTVKYYKVTLDGSDFSIMSGEFREHYTDIEVSTTLGNADDTDSTSPILFYNNSNTLNVDFHELEVYRDGELIHDYVPVQGGIKDLVDSTFFPISVSGIEYGPTIQDPIIATYCKVNGTWRLLYGTDIDDVNTSGGGSATLIPKTITENGTYDPSDDHVDGYNEVTVNVEGGGESQPIDYSYLPNSVKANVLASSDYTMEERGNFGKLHVVPYTVSADVSYTIDTDGAFLPRGVGLYFLLGEVNPSATVYYVGKRDAVSNDYFPIALPYEHSSYCCPCFYGANRVGANVEYSTYNTNTATDKYIEDEHIYAMSIDGENKVAKFYLDGAYLGQKSFSACGNTVVFSKGSPIGSGFEANAYFKYGGVVDGIESDATVIANMQTIAMKLGLTI